LNTPKVFERLETIATRAVLIATVLDFALRVFAWFS